WARVAGVTSCLPATACAAGAAAAAKRGFGLVIIAPGGLLARGSSTRTEGVKECPHRLPAASHRSGEHLGASVDGTPRASVGSFSNRLRTHRIFAARRGRGNGPIGVSRKGAEMTDASAINDASRRLTLALDALAAAVERRQEADRGEATLDAQLHALEADRS